MFLLFVYIYIAVWNSVIKDERGVLETH